ncbi:uncharacterized protein LOC128524663 isoform X1 [Clarias gariepinus]|uniref:uncharacterized protein LOC128524663 isoform X1 n=1 Tax=Clarias gariepinus TaxID=13013 RepID=UPI00234D09F7|nr:uncharacterized protein LOC128524663 isoform X1 [Clarias gariepinus]
MDTGLLLAFMRSKGCNVSRWRCMTLPHSLQRDGVSCGVFMCKFAQRLLQDQPVWFSNETQLIDKHRRKMAVRLLQESDCLQCLRQVDSHVLQWKPTNGCGLFLCAV